MNTQIIAVRELSVQWNHVDGPMMRCTDGRLKWLSLRERFMHWVGIWSLPYIESRK